MIQLINVNKIDKKASIKNVNVELKEGESTVIVGTNLEQKTLLLKVMSGIYQPDEGNVNFNGAQLKLMDKTFFYVPSEPGYKEFSDVRQLFKHYTLYYDNFDKDLTKVMNSVQISMNDLLETLCFSKIKLVYLIIALYSNSKYIFLDNILANVTQEVKEHMLRIMKKNRLKNQGLIFTAKDLEGLDGIIQNVMIVKDNVNIYPTTILNQYLKVTLSFKEKIDVEEFKKYKFNYMYPMKRTAIVIMKDDDTYIKNVFTDCSPSSYDILDLELDDIFHCIGDYI
ncbi:MAG: ATP-binding cassette domain-containing protein [bacterium]